MCLGDAMKCVLCGFEDETKSGIGATVVIGRLDECPKCHADLHSCIQCLHHDSKVYNECVETQADPVKVKDRSNFCDYFTANKGLVATKNSQDEMKKAAEALFKQIK
jgi:hypothetical protein